MSDERTEELFTRLRETEAQTREQNVKLDALSRQVDTMLSRWDSQVERMWKVIAILIGALLALALGPKVAEKIVATCMVGKCDIAPWHNDRENWKFV